MNILLVNPEVPETYWSMSHAMRFMGKRAFLPPLGLLTVAAMLPEGWEKRLVDMNTDELRDGDILWADYVFISAMLIQRASVDEVVERCGRLGAKVVAGGPLFVNIPEEYLHVDHLVLKEAEVTLREFVADVEKGCARKVYSTRERPELKDTPAPMWELIDLRKYASMSVQWSRGCPFNCDFCDVTKVFGHRIRRKSGGQVVAELEKLYRLGWRGKVFFVDDNLIGHKPGLRRDLLPAVKEWMRARGYPFVFNTQATIDLADDEELMGEMVEAGFDCVFVGIETPNEEALAECNKGQNRGRDLLECVRRIQRAGMDVQGGFILGFDSDEEGVFDGLIEFIQASGIVTAMVGLLNAPRGTALFKRLSGEQRLLYKVPGDNMDCSINFLPRMGLERLLEGYQRVAETIYSPEKYSERVLRLFGNWRVPGWRRARLYRSEWRALFASAWKLGVVSAGRRNYWRVMLWAMLRTRYLGAAITFCINGYHHLRVSEQVEGRVRCSLEEQEREFQAGRSDGADAAEDMVSSGAESAGEMMPYEEMGGRQGTTDVPEFRICT